MSFSDIGFTDTGEAYSRFWNKYERPPASIYRQFIIDRRDLLVPQNIREVKGSFFTPKIWADKSKEYIAQVFGDTWQEEYYVWDCAAGTGNLLAGLSNKYNRARSTRSFCRAANLRFAYSSCKTVAYIWNVMGNTP